MTRRTLIVAAVCLMTGGTASVGAQELQITSRPVVVAWAGEAYDYQVKAPGAEAIRYELIKAPAGMTVDAAGRVAWKPGNNDCYYQSVMVQASSGEAKARQEFEIFVGGVPEDVAQAMRTVNQKFKGADHSLASFGDSISVSFAWVLDTTWQRNTRNGPWGNGSGIVYIPHGPEHGSTGGWTTRDLLGTLDGKFTPSVIDHALATDRPEVATLMLGTNDIVRIPVAEYLRNMETIVDKMLARNCVPILVVPSRFTWKGFDVRQYFSGLRELSRRKKLVLIDFDLLTQNEPDPAMLFSDGVHPANHSADPYPWTDRTAGYNIINDAIYRTYAAMIKENVIEGPPR